MLRDLYNVDILTLIIMGCLLLIAVSKTSFPKRFDQFTLLLFNSRYSNLYIKDQRFFDIFEGLLFFNLLLNIGLLVYSYLTFHYLDSISQLDIFKYAILIGLFIVLKVLFERLLSSVLDIEAIIDKYLFQKISFRNFIGLLLLPINAVLIYTFKPDQTVFYIVFSVILLILFFGLFLFVKNNLNTFKKSLFYFILYLCALEIAPYVVLYKIIVTK
ncbi:DUF4271 domain-containing protein [Olleya aquimaris]|uniref:Uncharacterized protein DUF4271 n=1 Tax=Olleya aquimaris TaxID=639310 RepID=A0A327RP66_9FLAO|nr:DUF4271 domain-containing protein [Olleya aquimaris]RAJ18115.1 uncharacterized protein DUF4271 [Olleya aquimaris]